ncbi:E3 ubiquitin-protein ligase CBL-C [Taenia crassiceps]|uniref:E3 ubiquitin-protein ligase CBL n=1 Tax=Taenia crassiceps TaxID=6207 RepID=A0ABR4QKL6_9CEST
MQRQKSSFSDACDITGKALKVAEAQISVLLFKQRFHRQHESLKCEKHIKDTVEQLKNLRGILSQVQTPSEQSSLYPHFFEYWKNFFASLTKLTNQFELQIRSRSKHFEREAFNKYTSFFYHMAEELKFVFPNGRFATNQVFGRRDAQCWWESNFDSRVVVASDEFWDRFKREFPDAIDDGGALFDTIGFSSPDYVSKYDLDIFTRLFGAWSFLTRVWRRLVNHPGYQKYGTFNTTFDVLDGCRTTPGSYTFRISMSRNGFWSIGYVSAEGKIIQLLCFVSSIAQHLCDGKQQGLFKYPKGQACLDDLSDVSNMKIKVELQRHPGEDEDLLTCKICGVDLNDTQLEPCGHFICSHCCRRIQAAAPSKTSPLCYQCSSKILCTTPIEIQVKMIGVEDSYPRAAFGNQRPFKNFSSGNELSASHANEHDFTPPRHQNSFNRGRPKNQDILGVAARVAAVCNRDQETVEVDLRILCGDGFALEQIAEALITAGGDRAKAKEALQSSPHANEHDFTPPRHQNSFNRGRPKNQDILGVAARVAAVCNRDQETVEVDLRILCGDGFALEQIAEALITAGGDRAKAKEALQSSPHANEHEYAHIKPMNSFNRGRPKNQDILGVAARVAAVCNRDQETVEVDLRILCGDGFALEQIAEALITAGGDRAKAKEALQSSPLTTNQH